MRRFAWMLSFGMGLLSLSQEILWVRMLSFGQEGRPQAFALVLVAFLLGISLGAIVGRHLCARSMQLLASAGRVLCWAAALDVIALQLAAPLLDDTPARLGALLLLIALTAGAKGVIFPIVHHLGSDTARSGLGRSVSHVYLANVLGSGLGPLLTGFWLLDVVRVESAWAVVAAGTALLALACLLVDPVRHLSRTVLPLLLTGVAAGLVVWPIDVIEKVAERTDNADRLGQVIQNKHGILHTVVRPGGDITYGGNVYDGRIAVDMSSNLNKLDRAYLMAILHPKPRRVLVIGLSTGAWARAVLGFPGVEKMDIVEINPGYKALIASHPAVAPVLDDPRVTLHIDDGRRWLRAHRGERYDLIFQNTTFHWRAYATLLLSREYLQETQQHLAQGGIVTLNTTGSLDAYATALAVFKHVVRYDNFAYMSDQPLQRRPDAEDVLRACRIGNRPSFHDKLFKLPRIGWQLLTEPLEDAREHLRTSRSAERPGVITDLNMLNEFRHGRPPLFDWLAPMLPPHD